MPDTKYIFLDTNNWIYLSNGFNILSNKFDELHLKIFEIIKKRTDEGLLIFLVNDIVINEWNRNKPETEKQLKELENKFNGYSDSLRTIKNFLGKDSTELKTINKELLISFNEKSERLRKHAFEVEDFLINKTLKIDINDEIKIEAANLALEKKAPFIGDKKNSMADAIILLNSVDYIFKNLSTQFPPELFTTTEEHVYYPDSYFVSSNKGDFSSAENKEKIHPDLEPLLNKTKTEFFFTLAKLINSLEEELITMEEAYAIEHADDSTFCEYCNFTYYPTVSYSEYFYIPDENKGPNLVNQYRIKFEESEEDGVYKEEDFMTLTRTASCSNCGDEFIECSCGELNIIENYNTPFPCTMNCGNFLLVNAISDKKGIVYHKDYKILKGYLCSCCNVYVDEINEYEMCSDCVEKNSYEE